MTPLLPLKVVDGRAKGLSVVLTDARGRFIARMWNNKQFNPLAMAQLIAHTVNSADHNTAHHWTQAERQTSVTALSTYRDHLRQVVDALHAAATDQYGNTPCDLRTAALAHETALAALDIAIRLVNSDHKSLDDLQRADARDPLEVMLLSV